MSRFKILTPNGFKQFHGMKKSYSKCIRLIFSDGSTLKCTKEHKLELTNGKFVFAKSLKPKNEVKSNNGNITVVETSYIGDDFVYDVLHVDGGNTYYTNNVISHNCEFMGSSGTLVSGAVLKTLVHKEPIYSKDGFKQYFIPDKKNSYIILCDVSRGKGLDYSAFSVIDITKMPYDQVATFKSNTITPNDYAFVINKIGLLYNGASVLVENNDIGGQVASLLFDDYEYDNLLFTQSNGRSGKVLCGGGSNADPSIRTTTPVKAKGCSVLKLLIEQNQLIINDFDTINELSRFSKKGKSYEAEDGHDDMVMGLVLFAWCTVQPYFSNLSDINTMHNLRDGDEMWDDFVPFGFILDGSEEEIEIDNEGRIWKQTDSWNINY